MQQVNLSIIKNKTKEKDEKQAENELKANLALGFI